MSRNEIVAEKLVKLRGDKSRETVAKACGISISALAMYERGERIPRDDIKVRLAEYYNRSVNFIFFDLNEHKGGVMPRVRALTYPARVADRRKVLAKKCKLRLTECGVRQKKIAKLLGISEAALSTQLSGMLSIETLIAIADMTDWTAEELGKAIKN